MSWGTDYLNAQVGYLTRGDIDGLMRDHYHDDAELVTFEFVLKGKQAIRKYLAEDEPAQAGQVSGVEMLYLAESDDTIIFTSRVRSAKMGNFIARDALYFKDGKILKHIALTLPPDKDVKSDWGDVPEAERRSAGTDAG